MIGYNSQISRQWTEWVESLKSDGIRQIEIVPYIEKWWKENNIKKVCDIGCGQGVVSTLFKNTEYIGIDPSKQLINRAQELYNSPDRIFSIGDAYNTGLSGQIFDGIISLWVWSHLDNLESASKEMYRLLKKGGKFLIITAHPESYDERIHFYKKYKIKDNLLVGDFDLGNGKILSESTLYLHSENSILSYIKSTGLQITNIGKLGKLAKTSKGLYIVIEGQK